MLVTPKIFLKSRFFLISNRKNALKKLLIRHRFAKWTSETMKMILVISLDILIPSTGKYRDHYLEKIKKIIISPQNCQKSVIFTQIGEFSLFRSNIWAWKYFLYQKICVVKLKKFFLNSRFMYLLNILGEGLQNLDFSRFHKAKMYSPTWW